MRAARGASPAIRIGGPAAGPARTAGGDLVRTSGVINGRGGSPSASPAAPFSVERLARIDFAAASSNGRPPQKRLLRDTFVTAAVWVDGRKRGRGSIARGSPRGLCAVTPWGVSGAFLTCAPKTGDFCLECGGGCCPFEPVFF